MSTITEVLKEPLSDVRNTASLLGLEQIQGESETTFRSRVAYRFLLEQEKPLSGRMLLRVAYWAIRANLEAKGFVVSDLCAYKGGMLALVEKN